MFYFCIFKKAESTYCRQAHRLTSIKHKQFYLLSWGYNTWEGTTKTRTTRSGTKGTTDGRGTTLTLGLGWLHPWGISEACYSRGESSSGAECTSSGMRSSSSLSSRVPFSQGCSTAPSSMAAADLSAPSGGACGVPKSPPHPMMGVPIRTWVSPIAGMGVPCGRTA
jgi:hypothetical protein